MNIDLSYPAQAALDAEGPLLVLGGPGSGKTTLALLKAQRLIPAMQPGQQALFLSFSRAAVRQVLVRCRDILTDGERQLITVKTYHAFCMDLLKSHGRLLTGQSPRIVYPAAARLAKAAHNGDWDEEQQRMAREEGIYCFEQFAPASVELLSRAACVLELIGRCFPVIVLDEFQDSDNAQWEMVKLLSQHSCLITLADPDQRIFEYDPKVDPERLNYLRAFLQPAEFDLGNVNYRSPNAKILVFADAVLRNEPLPDTDDVAVVSYWSNSLQAAVHAHVVWMHASLRRKGIPSPTVAVLARTNSLVADVSRWLSGTHRLRGTSYPPVEHHVVWDAELTTAAAEVVASVLEWPDHQPGPGVAATLDRVANYYDLKGAVKSSGAARHSGASYRTASMAVLDGEVPLQAAARQLVGAFAAGINLSGRPDADWLLARNVLDAIPGLEEVVADASLVRQFRATDETGSALGKVWLDSGNYGRAVEIVRRTLEAQQLTSANSEPAGIVLMTMHKAKGKEYDGVVMVEGPFDARFLGDRREPEPYLATRRLLRVAITRARHKVCIVRPGGARDLTGS